MCYSTFSGALHSVHSNRSLIYVISSETMGVKFFWKKEEAIEYWNTVVMGLNDEFINLRDLAQKIDDDFSLDLVSITTDSNGNKCLADRRETNIRDAVDLKNYLNEIRKVIAMQKIFKIPLAIKFRCFQLSLVSNI